MSLSVFFFVTEIIIVFVSLPVCVAIYVHLPVYISVSLPEFVSECVRVSIFVHLHDSVNVYVSALCLLMYICLIACMPVLVMCVFVCLCKFL